MIPLACASFLPRERMLVVVFLKYKLLCIIVLVSSFTSPGSLCAVNFHINSTLLCCFIILFTFYPEIFKSLYKNDIIFSVGIFVVEERERTVVTS